MWMPGLCTLERDAQTELAGPQLVLDLAPFRDIEYHAGHAHRLSGRSGHELPFASNPPHCPVVRAYDAEFGRQRCVATLPRRAQYFADYPIAIIRMQSVPEYF